MKHTLLSFIAFLLMPSLTFAAWINRTMESGGYTREFRVYLPADFDPDEEYSLCIGIHGLGDNKEGFANYMVNFQSIADTARIINVYPQGTPNLLLGNAWNSAAGNLGIYPSEQYDDVKFINELAELMQSEYNIPEDKTYVFGFSNGGFMVHRIACEDNRMFHGFASYAGTIGNKVWECEPERAVPIIHFHGTTDLNVGYGVNLFGKNVEESLKIWERNNKCNGYDKYDVPNTVADGYFVEHFVYRDCVAPLEFFKVNGMDHIIMQKYLHDISYAEETWRFFRRNQDQPVPTAIRSKDRLILSTFPNPVTDYLKVVVPATGDSHNLEISIWDYTGKKMSGISTDINTTGSIYQFDCSQFPGGLYVAKASNGKETFSSTFVVAR